MREINIKSGRNLAYLWVSLSLFCVLAGFVVYTQFFVHSKPTPKPTSDGFDYDELTQLVAAGDSEAMRKLGICFERGFNVPKSHHEALKYYSLSSEAGNMIARYHLAHMLISRGRISTVDEEKGHKLLIDLATMGDESAQLSLILYYFRKEDTEGKHTHTKEAYVWANLLLGGMGTRKKSDAVRFLGPSGDYEYMTFDAIESFRTSSYVNIRPEDVVLSEKRSVELFKAIRANKAKK